MLRAPHAPVPLLPVTYSIHISHACRSLTRVLPLQHLTLHRVKASQEWVHKTPSWTCTAALAASSIASYFSPRHWEKDCKEGPMILQRERFLLESGFYTQGAHHVLVKYTELPIHREWVLHPRAQQCFPYILISMYYVGKEVFFLLN